MQDFQNRLCSDLSITPITVSNWIKTKVIPPIEKIDGEEAYQKVIQDIIKSERLNKRANRFFKNNKAITYLGIKTKNRKQLLNHVIDFSDKTNLSIKEKVLALCLRQLESENLFYKKSMIYCFLQKQISSLPKENIKIIKNLYKDLIITNEDDDFLGAFYQSLNSISSKSKSGAFYTPKKVLQDIKVDNNKTILDPCCGSGSIFLSVLSKNHKSEYVYASDIDEIALLICRVNLVLFFHNPDIKCNFFKNDLFFENEVFKNKKFDYIITNPPWGYKFSIEQKHRLLKMYPNLSTTESFSIALFNSKKMISETGSLFFFLPYSFLNVYSHKKIRESLIIDKNKIRIKLLGNAFSGVLSESILFHLENKNCSAICIEKEDSNEYLIEKRTITKPNYIIHANSSELSDLIISKIYSVNHICLKNNASFALGIVTGNNNAFLENTKTSENEMIMRGKNIFPFSIQNSNCFIKFSREKYQQASALQFYRNKKIVYRFINNRIVCAIDDSGKILLNSANLFIPNNDYPFESIVCLFNSSVYSFIFQKMFHSKKVLRSFLEALPLPSINQSIHEKLFLLHKKYIESKFNQDELDIEIAKLFCLTSDEINYIKMNTK